MEDHNDIHTSIYCHHRYDQPSEFVPIAEAMALLTLNSPLHDIVLCGAVSKSCDAYSLQSGLAKFHFSEVGMLFAHPTNTKYIGLTIKDTFTSGFIFFLYKCSVKRFECEVRPVIFTSAYD